MEMELAVDPKAQAVIDSYKEFWAFLHAKQGVDGISIFTLKEAAIALGISPSGVSKKLKRLLTLKAIGKIASGSYRIIGNENDLFRPFTTMAMIFMLLREEPEIFQHYEIQAQKLNVSLKEIQIAWGYSHYFNGSPYADIEIRN